MVELRKTKIRAGWYELSDPVSLWPVATVMRHSDGIWRRSTPARAPEWLVVPDLDFGALGHAVDYTRAEYSHHLSARNSDRRGR